MGFFVDAGQLVKLVVDIARAAGWFVRAAFVHEVLLSFCPVWRLERVVDVGEDFVQEGLAGLWYLISDLWLGCPDRRQLAMIISHANLLCFLYACHWFLFISNNVGKGHLLFLDHLFITDYRACYLTVSLLQLSLGCPIALTPKIWIICRWQVRRNSKHWLYL